MRKKQPDGTIAYERIDPITNQLVLLSLEHALPKICWDKFTKHDVSHILSTKEDFLSFWKWIEIWEVINRPHNILKSNTGDSSKKLGYDIGRLSSTPCIEGRSKGKISRAAVNATTASYMGLIPMIPTTLTRSLHKMRKWNKLMLPKTNIRINRINVPILGTHTPIPPTTTVVRRQKLMPWSIGQVSPPLPCSSIMLRLLIKGRHRPK